MIPFLEVLHPFLGEHLAAELLVPVRMALLDFAHDVQDDDFLITWNCDACGERIFPWSSRYAIAFGIPVKLCDAVCYDILRANWR